MLPRGAKGVTRGATRLCAQELLIFQVCDNASHWRRLESGRRQLRMPPLHLAGRLKSAVGWANRATRAAKMCSRVFNGAGTCTVFGPAGGGAWCLVSACSRSRCQ